MSDSPDPVDINDINDIDQLREHYKKLEKEKEDLKIIISDERQRNQHMQYKHRESIDEIAQLQNQKIQIEKLLEQQNVANKILLNQHSENSDDEDGTRYNTHDKENDSEASSVSDHDELVRLKEEIEDLQVALAEERMLGMQLDFSNRQSAQRADMLQYQLAEEKLKNLHLQSSHQKLQLDLTNRSDRIIDVDTDYDDDNDNQNNNENNNNNNKNHDDGNISDLSTDEFNKDLHIEEDQEDFEQDEEQQANELRRQLVDEQFKTEELKRAHRKSVMQLEEYKKEMEELRVKFDKENSPQNDEYIQQQQSSQTNQNQKLFGDSLDPESALIIESLSKQTPGGPNDELSEEERQEYENSILKLNSRISELEEELDQAKKKIKSQDKQRRNSLNLMSKNFFGKQLEQAQDHHIQSEALGKDIDTLKSTIEDLIQQKLRLLEITNATIDQLRQHIVNLSWRLRKYEKWDSIKSNNNNNSESSENSYEVTDL